MSLPKRVAIGVLVSGLAMSTLAAAHLAAAEQVRQSTATAVSSARSNWQQRVLDKGPTHRSKVKRAVQWSPGRKKPVKNVSTVMPAEQTAAKTNQSDSEVVLANAYEEIPAIEYADIELTGPALGDCADCGVGSESCDSCGACGTSDGCCLSFGRLKSARWTRDLSVFGGVHGFKGPADQGRNGNFGFQEGFNFGAPLGGPWGIGYQLGLTASQSNFAGNQADQQIGTTSDDRNQVFFTAGMFRRKLCGGWQWAVAFDLLHDNYYGTADLKQIRSETSFRLPDGKREVGYFGAYGTGGDDLVLLDRRQLGLQPTDLFAFYYRRYFCAGGQGRLWGGFSGGGDALIGGEIRVPIGESWALESRINYLIPKQASGAGGGQGEESWGLIVNLVYYVGQSARCVDQSPYRPMLSVADNTMFMADVFTSGN